MINTTDYAELVQNVLDGNESALTALGILREQKKAIEDCINAIEPAALDEAANYSEKNFNYKGFSITKVNGGRIYSFKDIKEWKIYKKALKDCEERSKQAYQSQESGLLTATQDGEEVDLPIVTYRKDSIQIKRVK